MSDSNVIKLAQPGAFTDSLTEILRNRARALLTQAVEAEVAEFLAKAEQLDTVQRWYRILSEALRKYLHGRQLIPPAHLQPA